MRQAQKALAGFLPLIDWPRFRRRNLYGEVAIDTGGIAILACGDDSQAVAWLLRTDAVTEYGRLSRVVRPAYPWIGIPGLAPGHYQVTNWGTERGVTLGQSETRHEGGALTIAPPGLVTDLAIAIRRIG